MSSFSAPVHAAEYHDKWPESVRYWPAAGRGPAVPVPTPTAGPALGGQRSSSPLLLVPRCLNPPARGGLVLGEGGASLEDLEPHPAPASPRGTAETQTTSLRAPLSPSPAKGKTPRSHEMQVANRVDAARPVGCAHRPRASPGSESAFVSAVHTSPPPPRRPQTGRGGGLERGRCLHLPTVPLLLGFERACKVIRCTFTPPAGFWYGPSK